MPWVGGLKGLGWLGLSGAYATMMALLQILKQSLGNWTRRLKRLMYGSVKWADIRIGPTGQRIK